MSQPSREEYNTLKTQYDQLLEKHQNDTIKIKQKEQALNQQLQAQQTQHQTQIQQLQALIAQLQAQIADKQQSKAADPIWNKRVSELQSDVRRLMDQNILLTAENSRLKNESNRLQSSVEDLNLQIKRMKEYIKSLEKDVEQWRNRQTSNEQSHKQMSNVSSLTEQKLITQEQLNLLKQKQEKANQNAQQLRQQLKQAEEETQKAQERERKAMQLLKKKEAELSALENEINAIKISNRDKRKSQASEKNCMKCADHQQEIQLLKQMVRSTQGMVRVREIENEKFRMHSEEVISNQSRSNMKPREKGTPLPPLNKKR